MNLSKLANLVPWLVSGALGILLFIAYRDNQAGIARQAQMQILLAQSDSAYKAATKRADSAAAHLTIDTVVVTHDVVHYTAVHDTVLAHLTDTVLVKQFVAVADTTIHACTRALNDCEQLTTALRSQLEASQNQIAALKRYTPTFVQRHDGLLAVLTAVGGFYLGTRVK